MTSSLADIAQLSPGTLVHILALVCSAGEAFTFIARSSNKEHAMRDVRLWGGSGADGRRVVDLLLWGKHAQQGGFEVGSAVHRKSARVGKYQGVEQPNQPRD